MSKFKSQSKRVLIGAVTTVTAPLHMGLQLSSNIIQVAANKVADGEGYLVSKIDKQRDPVEVSKLRTEYTQNKFRQTAEKLKRFEEQARQSIQAADDEITNIKNRMTAPKPAAVDNAHYDEVLWPKPIKNNNAPETE